MTVTKIDLDDAVLAQVMRIAGVRSKGAAVNIALREYVTRFRVAAL